MKSEVKFEIIATGSQGNAVVIEDVLMIDCGVPYKAICRVAKGLQLVLLTHIHTDHFNRTTIGRLAQERPLLRFGCGKWLIPELMKCGVSPANIDVMVDGWTCRYGFAEIEPFSLHHDVSNFGYKILSPHGNVFYATDTNNLDGITAKDYDLYLIEANYTDDEILERISAKKEAGEYAYERRVLEFHLSKAKADNFIYKNIGPNGRYVYLHGHIDGRNQCADDSEGSQTGSMGNNC